MQQTPHNYAVTEPGISFEVVIALDLSVLDVNTKNVTISWRGSYNEVCNFSYALVEWRSIDECNSSLFTLYNRSDNTIELPRLNSTGGEAVFSISVHECPPLLVNNIRPVSFRSCEFIVFLTLILLLISYIIFVMQLITLILPWFHLGMIAAVVSVLTVHLH